MSSAIPNIHSLQEGPMRFYRGVHRHYCGVDLHARTMHVCLMDHQGTILVHEGIPSEPEAFLRLIAPYREDLVVCAECIFCWYWLADLCAAHGIHFVLAHALYLKAIHGAKSKNDAVDSEKLCTLLRGGVIPQAYVYPPRLRATRDLMRRRLFFTRKRAELFCHIENTFHQYNQKKPLSAVSSAKQRAQLAAWFPDPMVRASVAADLARCTAYDLRIQALVKLIEQQARTQEPSALALLRTIPGVGRILGLTILYEIDTIERFLRVQDFSSYCRLVKPEHSSDGKRLG
ncbi:MAG: IS110 family transposase, partial [Betaproteobacteria bacterium]|nr:IS110 family transposase [Betaproteobacteria bacterium]